MAETSSDAFFSIENTMDMGVGNSKMLEGFLADTPPTNPDEVTLLGKEPAPAAKKVVPVKKEEKKEEVKIEEKKINPLDSLLGKKDGEEEEEEDVDTTTDTTTKKGIKKEEEEIEEEKEGNVFSEISKNLFELGVFSKDEDEEDVDISTPQAFKERFEYEGQKKATEKLEAFLSQFGDGYKEAFQAIYVKGVDPQEYFTTALNIQNFAEMDLSKEANQIAVIKQGLLNTGFEPEDLDAEVERIKNYGDLESTTQRFHKGLVKKEAAKLEQLEKEKEQKLMQEHDTRQLYYKNVNSVLESKIKAKEFDGIPINPKLAQEVQEFLLADKYKTNSGEKLTEFDKAILDLKRPENHEKKVKLAVLMKLMEKDPTFSTIQKAGVSKKSNEVFENLAKHKAPAKVSSSKESPQKWFM